MVITVNKEKSTLNKDKMNVSIVDFEVNVALVKDYYLKTDSWSSNEMNVVSTSNLWRNIMVLNVAGIEKFLAIGKCSWP